MGHEGTEASLLSWESLTQSAAWVTRYVNASGTIATTGINTTDWHQHVPSDNQSASGPACEGHSDASELLELLELELEEESESELESVGSEPASSPPPASVIMDAGPAGPPDI